MLLTDKIRFYTNSNPWFDKAKEHRIVRSFRWSEANVIRPFAKTQVHHISLYHFRARAPIIDPLNFSAHSTLDDFNFPKLCILYTRQNKWNDIWSACIKRRITEMLKKQQYANALFNISTCSLPLDCWYMKSVYKKENHSYFYRTRTHFVERSNEKENK